MVVDCEGFDEIDVVNAPHSCGGVLGSDRDRRLLLET
jgi:hypothetical protein